MKSFILFVLMFFGVVAFGQTNSAVKPKPVPPSDAPNGFTYDFDKTIKLIIDRLANPNEFNKDVEPLISAADFPKFKKAGSVDSDMKSKITGWMEKNPELIINTLKHRSDIVTPF